MDVDLHKYTDFVKTVTSPETEDAEALIRRIQELKQDARINVSVLLNAAQGLGSEGGEFQEIVKKIVFQGKPLTNENIFHMKRELGDIIWYWTNACRALGLDPNDVIAENVEKLKARYPTGEFNVYHSENRRDGDL